MMKMETCSGGGGHPNQHTQMEIETKTNMLSLDRYGNPYQDAEKIFLTKICVSKEPLNHNSTLGIQKYHTYIEK